MITIGDYNLMIIDRSTDFGFFLMDKERTREVLMPNRYITDDMHIGDFVEVFVYMDSEDRIVATTEEPKLTVGEFGFLEVVAESRFGAFLDWGLPRDLLVPFGEMEVPMKRKNFYPVYLFLDESSERLVASSKIYRFLSPATADAFEYNQEVNIFAYEETEIGFKVVVDSKFRGMVYKSEIFSGFGVGSTSAAYVEAVREDGKIDLSLRPLGYEAIDDVSLLILKKLQSAGGFLPYHDKSSPEEIQKAFQLSKKIFKKAIGKLYKERKIMISEDGFRIN